jgi:hypothetical protein
MNTKIRGKSLPLGFCVTWGGGGGAVKRSVLWRLLGLTARLVALTSSATICTDGVVSQGAPRLNSTVEFGSLFSSRLSFL